MQQEINLLSKLPRGKRNVNARAEAKTDEIIAISRQYGELYFEAFGLDISEYALMHCEPEVVGRLHLGNAVKLPFPDNSFKAVISLNTVHNLDRGECITALREIERLAPGRAFVQVDSYRNAEQKALFEEWVLTAKFHDYPDGWVAAFREAGYTGDYYWTIIE